MALHELMHAWNSTDSEGRSIQPPLSEDEVAALEQYGVGPETRIAYERFDDIARTAFILCNHFRVPGNPELTAQTVAAFK